MARTEITYNWLQSKRTIQVADIMELKCEDKVTFARTKDGLGHPMSMEHSGLNSVANMVKEFEGQFVIVRRGYAVRFEAIDFITNGRLEYGDSHSQCMHLKNGTRIRIARRSVKAVNATIEQWKARQPVA